MFFQTKRIKINFEGMPLVSKMDDFLEMFQKWRIFWKFSKNSSIFETTGFPYISYAHAHTGLRSSATECKTQKMPSMAKKSGIALLEDYWTIRKSTVIKSKVHFASGNVLLKNPFIQPSMRYFPFDGIVEVCRLSNYGCFLFRYELFSTAQAVLL